MRLDNAPPSYKIHGGFKFSGVRQEMPTSIESRALAICSRGRPPLSILSVENQGLADCRTVGSQSLRAFATCLLRGPDQLTKMLCGFVLIAA